MIPNEAVDIGIRIVPREGLGYILLCLRGFAAEERRSEEEIDDKGEGERGKKGIRFVVMTSNIILFWTSLMTRFDAPQTSRGTIMITFIYAEERVNMKEKNRERDGEGRGKGRGG